MFNIQQISIGSSQKKNKGQLLVNNWVSNALGELSQQEQEPKDPIFDENNEGENNEVQEETPPVPQKENRLLQMNMQVSFNVMTQLKK